MPKKVLDNSNVIKSIFLAYFILIFHVGLLAVLGVLVLFFGGLVNYLVWILIGGGVLTAGAIYFVLRHFKKNSVSLAKILMQPEFRGKNIEVKFLGGLASVKIHDAPEHMARLNSGPSRFSLEDPEMARIRELKELANLLEKDLITPDEYHRAKRELFGS